jgi:type I restriction enzyme S subunit
VSGVVKELGEVVDVLSGFPYKSELFNDTEGVPVIRIRDVVRGYSDTRYSGAYSEAHVIQNGEIVIGMDGNFNAARWNGGPSVLNQRVCRLAAHEDQLDEDYLFHFLPAALKTIEDATPFVTVKHLSVAGIRGIKIPLPPLPEQRRIAAILDQADALRAKRREALAQLDSLTQSIFIEMFGDPVRNPKGWPTGRLGEHVTKLGSGSTPTGGDAAYKDVGISLIRSLNVHDGEFKYKNLAHIDDQQAAKLANVAVETNDVLLNITGASVARVCSVPNDVLPARVNQHVMIIRTKPSLKSTFLERMLLNPEMKKRLLQIGGAGATREAITKAQAEELVVICPPIQVQGEFVRRLTAIAAIKRQQISAVVTQDALFTSLQHRAFRGEL